MGEKLSGPFEVSRSSDGTSQWFSARDPAAGVSIRAKDRADALSMVSALNACVAHHVTTRAPADLRSALEAETIERCAKVAEDFEGRGALERCDDPTGAIANEIADLIRALIPTKEDAS